MVRPSGPSARPSAVQNNDIGHNDESRATHSRREETDTDSRDRETSQFRAFVTLADVLHDPKGPGGYQGSDDESDSDDEEHEQHSQRRFSRKLLPPAHPHALCSETQDMLAYARLILSLMYGNQRAVMILARGPNSWPRATRALGQDWPAHAGEIRSCQSQGGSHPEDLPHFTCSGCAIFADRMLRAWCPVSCVPPFLAAASQSPTDGD